jgi:hypothetical protein
MKKRPAFKFDSIPTELQHPLIHAPQSVVNAAIAEYGELILAKIGGDLFKPWNEILGDLSGCVLKKYLIAIAFHMRK